MKLAFLEQVSKKSEILQKRLREIQVKYPKQIKTIRGEGLMLGAEFAEPPTEVIKKARELGLLIITAGKSTVRFVPALTIEDELIEEGLNVFEKAIEAVYA